MKTRIIFSIFSLIIMSIFSSSCRRNKDEVPQPTTEDAGLTINEPEYYLNEAGGQVTLTVSASSLGEETGVSFKARSSSREYPIVPIFMEYNKYSQKYQGTTKVPAQEGDTLWVTLFSENEDDGTFDRLDVIPGASLWKHWTYLPNVGEAYYVLPGSSSADSVQLKFGDIELLPNSMDVRIIGVNYADDIQKIYLSALVGTKILIEDSLEVQPGLFDEVISLDGFTSNNLVDLYLKVNTFTVFTQVKTPKNEYTKLKLTSSNGTDSVLITPQKNLILGEVTGLSTGSIDLVSATLTVSVDSMSDSTDLSDYLLDVEGFTTWDPSNWTRSGNIWSVTVPVTKTSPLGNFSFPLFVKTNKNFPNSGDKAVCQISLKDKDGVVILPPEEIWMVFKN